MSNLHERFRDGADVRFQIIDEDGNPARLKGMMEVTYMGDRTEVWIKARLLTYRQHGAGIRWNMRNVENFSYIEEEGDEG